MGKILSTIKVIQHNDLYILTLLKIDGTILLILTQALVLLALYGMFFQLSPAIASSDLELQVQSVIKQFYGSGTSGTLQKELSCSVELRATYLSSRPSTIILKYRVTPSALCIYFDSCIANPMSKNYFKRKIGDIIMYRDDSVIAYDSTSGKVYEYKLPIQDTKRLGIGGRLNYQALFSYTQSLFAEASRKWSELDIEISEIKKESTVIAHITLPGPIRILGRGPVTSLECWINLDSHTVLKVKALKDSNIIFETNYDSVETLPDGRRFPMVITTTFMAGEMEVENKFVHRKNTKKKITQRETLFLPPRIVKSRFVWLEDYATVVPTRVTIFNADGVEVIMDFIFYNWSAFTIKKGKW